MTHGSGREETRLRRDFVAEAQEILERAAETLAVLVPGDPHPEALNRLFRGIHSLKGLAGMVGLPAYAAGAHDLEDLLDEIRMGRVPLDAGSLATLGVGLRALGEGARLVAGGAANPEIDAGARERLRAAAAPRAGTGQASPALSIPEELDRLFTEYERHRLEECVRKGSRVLLVPLELDFDTFDQTLRAGMAAAGVLGELVGTFPGESSSADRMSFRLLVAAPPSIPGAEVAARCGGTSWVPLYDPPVKAEPQVEEGPSQASSSVRVGLEKIDALLDLAGELALARGALRNALARLFAAPDDRRARIDAQRAFAQLDRSVSGLSGAALATRLIPVDQITARLARAARSIATAQGKEISFEVVGGETEIDKVVADALADALLHVVRNAVDHGIEPPAERERAGKPRAGRLVVTAETRGREVLLRMTDDGRGIDAGAVLGRARERGVLKASDPDPARPLELIFRPGFSTAAAVSEVSGRGVGLDVVRSTLASLKGRVEVRTDVGAGSTFDVVVPMTLAVVEALLVRSGGRLFAFPSASVAFTYLVEPGSPAAGGTDPTNDGRESIPIVGLDALLGLAQDTEVGRRAVVVAEEGSHRVGFLVSRIEGLEDLVFRPLAPEIPRHPVITGTAEIAGGDLALTLDTGLLVSGARGGERLSW